MKTKNDTINAIQTMVDSAVNKAGYDKTRNAMVIARNSNNTYEIEMDSIRYSNVVLYGSGVLQTNEIVKVVIPNNQASQMYILGKGVIEGRKQGSVNGLNSNAFGLGTEARGGNSFAEGEYTKAIGAGSHAEGGVTEASGIFSHAEGYSTTAEGGWSHAEGYNTKAEGYYSHAEGEGTIAGGAYQHVEGAWNVPSDDFIHIVGNGNEDTPRNAYALDWGGNGHYMGGIYMNCSDDSSDGDRVPVIQHGRGSATFASTGTPSSAGGMSYFTKSVDITFDKPFTIAPHVVATLNTEFANVFCHVYNVSVNGFTLTITRVANTASANTVSFDWIAACR